MQLAIHRKLTLLGDLKRRIESQQKILMADLKKNFNFIEGAKARHQWQFELSLSKKILRPAQAIAVCNQTCVDLLSQNSTFWDYLKRVKKQFLQEEAKPERLSKSGVESLRVDDTDDEHPNYESKFIGKQKPKISVQDCVIDQT